MIMALAICSMIIFPECSRYPVSSGALDGGEEPISDAADAGDGGDGQIDVEAADLDDNGCEPLEVRTAACFSWEEFGWATCPMDPLPDDCAEDCPYIGKPHCLQWWDDNVCLYSEGVLQALDPDFSNEKVVLAIFYWALGPWGVGVRGEVCSGEARISADTCYPGYGGMDAGLLFAVVIPKALEPTFALGTVLCGEYCDQTGEWCEEDVGVAQENACAPNLSPCN